MADDYGYTLRPDPPPRFVPAPEKEPIRLAPRAVNRAAREGRATQGFQFVRVAMAGESGVSQGTDMIHQQDLGLSNTGAGGWSLTEGGWHAVSGRHGQLVERWSTSGESATQLYVPFNMSPRQLLDPARPVIPMVWRWEDVVAFELMSPPTGAYGEFHFGYGDRFNRLPQPFIGFYCRIDPPATVAFWASGRVHERRGRVNAARPFTGQRGHLLTLEIDTFNKQVFWFIDSIEQEAFAPVETDLGTHTPGEKHYFFWDQIAGFGTAETHVRAVYQIDFQATLSYMNLNIDGT